MKTPGLDKVLRNHFQHCKMHEYSLLEKRYCSCGIEKAREEMEVYELSLDWILRAYEWFKKHDSIGTSSIAKAELLEIVEKINAKR